MMGFTSKGEYPRRRLGCGSIVSDCVLWSKLVWVRYLEDYCDVNQLPD